jgi:hypothetical protein
MLARAAEEKAPLQMCTASEMSNLGAARRVARGRFQPQLLNGRFVNADGNEPRSRSLKRLCMMLN